MHQPAPGILYKNVALKNDPEDKGLDDSEDIAAKKNREKAFKSPGYPFANCKLTGIRADLHRKPSNDPINGSQNKNSQCQI